MPVIWTTMAPLLGGEVQFHLIQPDNVWVSSEGILVRGRLGSLSGTLCLVDGSWSVHPGMYLAPSAPSETRFATARDRRRIRHALVETWRGLWTAEAAEKVLPSWFRREWESIQTAMGLMRSAAERGNLFRRQNELLKRLTNG